MKKIWIADAGATKTDWIIYDGEKVVDNFRTQGISPVHQDVYTISDILALELKPKVQCLPDEVYFYGAGCLETHCATMAKLLSGQLHCACVEVASDLLGAARALCSHDAGIACILGTGANSCYYDGSRIVDNTPPLGYILGDEGSGAVMGKLFLGNVLKEVFSPNVCKTFFELTQADYHEILENVYRKPLANRYLASFASVISQMREQAEVHDFLVDHFRNFVLRNILRYKHPELPLNFVGGIANTFCLELAEAVNAEGMRVGKVEQSPLRGLLQYHCHH